MRRSSKPSLVASIQTVLRTARPILIALVVLLGLWTAIWTTGFVNPTLLASPVEVYKVLVQGRGMEQLGSIYQHAGHTIFRALVGWFWSVLIGAAAGVLVGFSRRLQDVLDPAIEFIRSTPPVLALPVFAVAFNYSDTSYTATIVFGCFPAMMISAITGMRAISPGLRETLWLYRVPLRTRVVASIMEAMPALLLGARLALSLAIIVATVTEMVITPRSGLSLGALARDSESRFNTPVFYACVVLIGAFGFVSNYLVRLLSSWLGAKEE
jgi:ABC-type nitrate/sulfonate/bicarbonate transport system permease component